MIFQAPFDLDIKNKKVQAIIDLETGFIGFTEIINEVTIEYYYGESPVEFRIAFMKKLENSFAEKSFGNMKICRKQNIMQKIGKLLRQDYLRIEKQ